MDPTDDHDQKKVKATSQTLYKNLPVNFTCPNCDYTGYTIVEQKTTYISFILMIIFIFLFGFIFSLVLMPVVILLTRSYFHKCPSCFKDVGSDNKILSILNLTDKVVSFNVGEFGVVLTRKIILGIFLTLVLMMTIYLKLTFHDHHHDGPVVYTQESWSTFLEECGREAFIDKNNEQIQARITFCETKYIEKTVLNWKGYVIRVEDYRKSFYSFMHHAVVILIRMEPSESELYPDVFLAIDSERASENTEIIASLNRGSEVKFNATVVALGTDMKTTHFHLVDLAKGQGYKELPAHVHEYGRYADKPKFLRNALPEGDDQHDQQDQHN